MVGRGVYRERARCDDLLCAYVRPICAWSVEMNCLYAVSLAAFVMACEFRIWSSCCCVFSEVEMGGGVGTMDLLKPVEVVADGLGE